MYLKRAATNGFCVSLSKTILFVFVLINLLASGGYGQTSFTRNQFARFPLLTRARFFENEILRAAQAEGVDPNVLWTIAYNETRFRPYLTSPKNAQGLMQFIPSTAARFDLNDPYDPVSAIRVAARYVKYLSNLFGGRLDSVLAAYNAGEGTVSAYLTGRILRTSGKTINPKSIKTIGGIPPYAETICYVGRGLKVYRWLISRGTFPVNVVRAYFPTVLTGAVAKVNLIDYELGKISDLKTPNPLPQLVAQVTNVNDAIVENTNPNLGQENKNNLTEIYYDSRSGNRYRVFNGQKTKLTENGIVVITNNSRSVTTNKARSTFFAVIPK